MRSDLFGGTVSSTNGTNGTNGTANGTVRGAALTLDQARRYARHIILPEVGPIGQRKLLAAKVLLIGAGGLGSPAALYLAAAGVGTIGIVDYDVVDLSNLHRQIIHGHANIGRPKVDSGRGRLADVNPAGQGIAYNEPLPSENTKET